MIGFQFRVRQNKKLAIQSADHILLDHVTYIISGVLLLVSAISPPRLVGWVEQNLPGTRSPTGYDIRSFFPIRS
jgi:hypothetical protein